MANLNLPFQNDTLLTYLTEPEGEAPRPGVVVIHDALGMTPDLRRQCDWLASEGYLAAAPDLFNGRTFFSCLFKVVREMKKRKGPLFEKVNAVQQYLLNHPDSNGKVGVIGFCFGGGFAVILSAGYGFDAAGVNYGGLPDDAEELLKNACPIVAGFGELDRYLKGTAADLKDILTKHGIDHDVKEYKNTDHAFMNDHDPKEIPLFIKIFSFVFGGGEYHAESAEDSRRRIIAFFDRYLK